MESAIDIRDREELIYLLSEACELEHVLCCAYLFAGFSMKRSVEEGITEGQLKAATGRADPGPQRTDGGRGGRSRLAGRRSRRWRQRTRSR